MHQHRMWIVQEQVLNCYTTMLHGHHLIPWLAIATVNILFYIEVPPWNEVTKHYADMPHDVPAGAEPYMAPEDVVYGVYNMWRHR